MKKVLIKSRFKKDLKAANARGKDLAKLETLVGLLVSDQTLPRKYELHPLKGNWQGCWDCHIEPDWLLIFEMDDKTITLVRTGSHSDLF